MPSRIWTLEKRFHHRVEDIRRIVRVEVTRRGDRTALLVAITQQTAIAVGVYLLITPGTLLDPLYFARGLLVDAHHYATGHGLAYGLALSDIHG